MEDELSKRCFTFSVFTQPRPFADIEVACFPQRGSSSSRMESASVLVVLRLRIEPLDES
jgi:hypothetical protein